MNKNTCAQPSTTELSTTTTGSVSLLAEIPKELHQSLMTHLENHPGWGQNRAFAAALSLFLLQNGHSNSLESSRNYRRTARVYLDSLFKEAA